MKRKYDFPELLTLFFTEYLIRQRGLSDNTVKAYRDTFVVFFKFLKEETHINPEKLSFEALTPDLIVRFLNWTEEGRGNAPSTRNSRLAALRSFIKYSLSQKPEILSQCRDILEIKSKKVQVKPPVYLSLPELKGILSLPDSKTKQGMRDLALLSLLYDSGARVQEIVDAKWLDVRLSKPATICLTGKGNKSRIIPLMPDTLRIVESYRASIDNFSLDEYIFKNRSGNQLTRSGVEYVIEKYANIAKQEIKSLNEKKITPHVYRHTKGMHLTEADVNIIYIRDLLGHVSVQTTERYARADTRTKRDALEKASENIIPKSVYSKEKQSDLLGFLKELI